MSSKVAAEVAKAGKNASQYFEKIDKSVLYHAGALSQTDWLLCPGKEDQNVQPSILLQGLMPPDEENCYVIAVPHSSARPFSAQELHQLIQELVEGLYVFNQTPSSNVETNHDSSMGCSLPSAYVDTFTGQTLLTVDYFIKSLLHGRTIPQREKRMRLNETWRKTALENPSGLHELYVEHGMFCMEEDEELGQDLYQDKEIQFLRYPPLLVDHPLAQSGLMAHLSTGETAAQHIRHVSRDVFRKYLDKTSLGLIIGQNSVHQDGSLIIFDPSLEVISSVEPGVDTSSMDTDLYTHLNMYLQKQREFIQERMKKKTSIVRDIELLQFASFIVHLLTTIKQQQHKVIDCSRLQPRMNPDLLKTEREFPPFIPSKSSRWSPYTSNNHYVGANGNIVFQKRELEVKGVSKSLKREKEKLLSKALKHEKEAMTVTVGKQLYSLITIRLEDFYPKFPRWIHAMVQELKSQITKLPPLSDGRIQDLLRRPLGPRQAIKLKTMNSLLVPTIVKGMTGCIATMLKRCTKTRINKPGEEDGLALIHHAAIHGRSDIISILMHNSANPNQFSELVNSTSSLSTGPLHLAAAAGDLDSVCCLLKHSALADGEDARGWSAVHYAAYHNHHKVVSHLASINRACVNLQTKDSLKTSPLLLAARNGGLDTVRVLAAYKDIDLSFCDSSCHNIVHVCAIKNHVNILQFLILLASPDLPVWQVLFDMLKSDTHSGYPHSAACVLDSLLRWKVECYEAIVKLGVVQQLIELAKLPEEKLQVLAIQVIADISNNTEVKSSLVKSNAIPVLVKHLSSANDRLQSATCTVLCDLALDDENRSTISANGGMEVLIKLSSSPQDDVQLYASACIGILGMENSNNQSLFRENGGLPRLIAMLQVTVDCLQGTAAAVLEAMMNECRENQLAGIDRGVIPPLVTLLRSRTTSVHSNAAKAIRALAKDCPESQAILQKDSTQCTTLLRRLLKSLVSDVKVCAATALWAIAGGQIENRRSIAQFMGLDTLIDLLAIHNKKLDYVCSEALGTMASQLQGDNQHIIAELGGLIPLVEVLISKSSEHVYISVLNTLGCLLTNPGLIPNVKLQKAVVEARGLTFVTALLLSQLSEAIRVNAACTLAKLVLNNPENEEKLNKQSGFSYLSVLKLLGSSDPEIRKTAGYALSIFLFNNPRKLEMVKSLGSINLSNFKGLLKSSDELFQAHAAFQLVTLSRLILNIKPLEASVHGIKALVQLCSSPSEKTKLLSTEFLACLARCRDGIPMTSVMAGALSPLMENLLTDNPPVEEISAIAIGLYSHQPLASRLIRSRFRSHPMLYKVFQKYLKYANPSRQFIEEWTSTEKAGLPSLSLEKHRGLATGQGWKIKRLSRTKSEPWAMGPPIRQHSQLHTLPSLIDGDISDHTSSRTISAGPLTQRKRALESTISQLPTV